MESATELDRVRHRMIERHLKPRGIRDPAVLDNINTSEEYRALQLRHDARRARDPEGP